MTHVVISASRCTGCRMCEYACSAAHEGIYRPSVARIGVDLNPTTGEIKGRTCLQSACGKCQAACPEQAIVEQEVALTIDGEWRSMKKYGDSPRVSYLVVDEAKCTGCGECYSVCPTRVIRAHPDRGTAVKCDLCGGSPRCIESCQNPYVLAIDAKSDRADPRLSQVEA